ncbi:MAG: MgtE intracellular region [Acidobacteria bacterium]|jgi:CBS domain-containing protein|nr:MgtE intracellular region [Acidobacteriota bacterium]
MIYFTELENLPTYTANGEYIGRLIDLAINPSQNPLLIGTYLVQTPAKTLFCIDRGQISTISVRSAQTSVSMSELRECAVDESFIRIKKDVLDQQIIDVNDQKVVRVGDVDFDIQPGEKNTDLRILAVNVGGAAAIRRLLQGLLAKHRIRQVSSIFPPKTIPWEFVSLIEPDPARRVKLRISYNRLAQLHPADLADILEELSRDEQRSVIESLDDETAAEAVSEISTRMQVALLNSLSAGRAADIVEEMAPDEAADVLQELSPEASAEVLANMETEEANEVRELLGFEENTAGGLMTTEFVVISESATVEESIAALKDFTGSLELLHAIYLVSSNAVLVGVVPLANIALSKRDAPMRDLTAEQLISVPFHADQKEVIGMFRKYNLLSLPVVDDNDRLLGIVTADDVLELVTKES